MSHPWSLVQYRTGTENTPTVGLLADGTVHECPDPIARQPLLELLRQWCSVEPILARPRPRVPALRACGDVGRP
jgi:hypothetical protein